MSSLNELERNRIVFRDANISRMALIVGVISPLVLFIDILSYQEKSYVLCVAAAVCAGLYFLGFRELIYIDGGTLYFECGFPALGKSKKESAALSEIVKIDQVTKERTINKKTTVAWVRYYIVYLDGRTVEAPLHSVFSLSSFRSEIAKASKTVSFNRRIEK